MSLMKRTGDYSKETILSVNFSTGRSTRRHKSADDTFLLCCHHVSAWKDAALIQFNFYK